MNKIGFACKWIDTPDQVNGIKLKDDARKYTTGTTTIAWLARQTKIVAEEKLWDLMVSNIEATRKLVEKVGKLDEQLRMVRLSSDILPVYTHHDWSIFWSRSDVVAYCEKHFREIGVIARASGTRLSFHPGQFTVLASANDNIVENSIKEFEYHADMARWMGYGKSFQDFKINVHISGKRGPEGIRQVLGRLSSEARNCITLENEECAWGLDDCLSLSDVVPTVLDIHHHFIREGEYIEATDSRIQRIIDSWRGVRPTFHYSQSREDYLVGHRCDIAPVHSTLLEDGYKKQKLRAHSDFMWNNACNEWALQHLAWGDCMVEAKAKNLASFRLFEFSKQHAIL